MSTLERPVTRVTEDFISAPYHLTINGQLVAAEETFDVINPATGKVLAQAPNATAEQLDEAIAAAKTPFKSWSALSYDERQGYLESYADALQENRDDLVRLLTLEQGKPLETMAGPEVDQAIVPQLFWGALGHQGQWCVGIKRLYVHRSFHAEFVQAFVDYAKTVKVGDGLDPEVGLGPVQNKMQFDKLKTFLDDIKANGQKIALGGEIDESQAGYFFPITVVDNPPEKSKIVQEEQFGPIVPIMAYDEVDEAVNRANDSIYGLGASVWGRDTQAAVAVANQLEAGMVWVNEIHTQGVDIPFGGVKQSGLGTEQGHEGRTLFTNPKTVLIHKFGLVETDPHRTYIEAIKVLQEAGVAYVSIAEADWDNAPDLPLSFRKAVRNNYSGGVIYAGRYTAERGARLLETGLADMVAFGRAFIANPDLPARIANGWPLNPLDATTLYGGAEKGFTDYPAYEAHATGVIARTVLYAVSQPDDVDVNEVIVRPVRQVM